MAIIEQEQIDMIETIQVPDAPKPPETQSPGARLWRNRAFNVFWASQPLSALGDGFALLARPLLVFQATGSVVQMGLVTGAFGVGQIVSGLVSGVIVDRVDRRKLPASAQVMWQSSSSA